MAHYVYTRGWQSIRGDVLTRVTGLPAWGRVIVLILALPGICLVGLSLLALLASIATLLILTVPAYALLRKLTAAFGGRRALQDRAASAAEPFADAFGARSPARRVEATVVEP